MSKRLLSLNVHYSPKSFGGATIVAEEVNAILADELDWQICVITTDQNKDLLPYQITRYRTKSVNVISINMPGGLEPGEKLVHAKFGKIVDDVLNVFRPDVVHMHAIQTMGVDFVQRVKNRGIPVVATLHDCWWICERQFMINRNGKYCFQETLEKKVCMHCVDDHLFLDMRWSTLRSMLGQIDKCLFPSEFHKGMHMLNGIDPDKCAVNKNGVRFPDRDIKHVSSPDVRFGFIGGPGFIKGGELISEVFEELEGKYKLFLVDAAQNVGQSWEDDFAELLENKHVKLVDAYDQDGMDDFFESIDVLLFPSQWKESFGLTVREALVRDVWVICTQSGGTVEDMRDGENATVIPLSTDASFLKKAVEDCIDRDWKNYSNPYKSDIKSYHDQAEELHGIFMEMVAHAEIMN